MKNVKKAVRRAAEVQRKPEVAETEESALGIEQVEDNFRAKRKAIRKFNPNNEQRLFRAIQWAKRGLAVENKVEQVILLWIAFNALYGCKEHLAPSAIGHACGKANRQLSGEYHFPWRRKALHRPAKMSGGPAGMPEQLRGHSRLPVCLPSLLALGGGRPGLGGLV